jgi:hypothetical protein
MTQTAVISSGRKSRAELTRIRPMTAQEGLP